MPLKTTKFIWHEGTPGALGTGHRARAEPRAALRLVGIRRHPRLPDAARRRRLQAHGPHAPPVRLGEDLPHQDPLLARADQRRRAARSCARTGCRAPTSGRSRFAATARSASRGTSTSRERVGRGLGMGHVPRRRRARARRRCLRLVLAARRAQHGAGAREGRRQLSVERARRRSRRAASASPRASRLSVRRLRERGRGRESVPRARTASSTRRRSPRRSCRASRATPSRGSRESLGLQVLEQNIPRELLYIADEVFLTGTAVEITPDALGRQDHGRRRQARPDHRALAEAASSACSTARPRPLGLARADRGEQKSGRIDRPIAV